MASGHELRDFLTSRRASLTPEEVGLPPSHSQRRVKGLRREEVAILAGVSVSAPVQGGALALGRWQGVYLWEHRTAPHQRSVLVTVLGAA